MSQSFNCSVFRSLQDTTPRVHFGLTWDALVNLIGAPKPFLAKTDAPLYSPAEFRDGETVKNTSVACIHFGVLDIDHITELALVGILENLQKENLAFYFVSTWSNKGGDDCCGRLVVPFSRPVLPSEWPEFWPGFSKVYGASLGDKATKDPSRRYFFPSQPMTLVAEPRTLALPGLPCDVDGILASSASGNRAFSKAPLRADRIIGAKVGVSGALNEAKLRQLASSWSRSYRKHQVKLGRALARVLEGEPFAKETGAPGNLPEGRHSTMFALAAALCEAFPNVLVEDMVALFSQSIEKMGRMDDSEVYKAVDYKSKEQQSALANLNMKSIGRPDAYTDEELEKFADMLCIPRHTLKNYFIIQKGKSYYVLKPDGYIHLTKEEFESSFKYQLAPASRAGVECIEVTKTGVRDKKPSEMVHEYGLIANSIVVDMTADMCTFDVATQSIIEAPCPIRVEPEYDQDVHDWLIALGGDDPEDVDKLLKWVALTPDLSVPCAALYLHGPGGVGKSLLGQGLSRIWSTDRPTGLDEALAPQFNDQTAKCPFIFADETISKVDTAKIRELIQSRKRPYLRKFMPPATLQGCVRVLLAANNDALLRSSDDLTNDDIDAISERFFELRTTAKPKDFLVEFRRRNPKRLADWVNKDIIAKHAMWLYKNVPVELSPDTRFAVRGSEKSSLALGMRVFTGLRSQICLWLVNFLREPGKLTDPKLKSTIYVKNGKLLVRSSTLADGWYTYIDNKERLPNPGILWKALGGLSSQKVVRVGSKTVRMRQIDMKALKLFASSTGYGTPKDLDEWMHNLSEKDTRVVEDSTSTEDDTNEYASE